MIYSRPHASGNRHQSLLLPFAEHTGPCICSGPDKRRSGCNRQSDKANRSPTSALPEGTGSYYPRHTRSYSLYSTGWNQSSTMPRHYPSAHIFPDNRKYRQKKHCPHCSLHSGPSPYPNECNAKLPPSNRTRTAYGYKPRRTPSHTGSNHKGHPRCSPIYSLHLTRNNAKMHW